MNIISYIFGDNNTTHQIVDTNKKDIQTFNTKERKYVKILCLDGGGLRGITYIRILQELEKKLGGPIRDYFDLIVGTSSGSIVGTLLCSNYTYDVYNSYYENMRIAVHNNTKNYMKILYNFLFGGYFLDDTELINMTRNMFKNITIGDITKSRPKLALITTCVDKQPYHPYVLRSYDVDNELAKLYDVEGCNVNNYTIDKVWNSTIRFPLLNKRHELNGKYLVDGGLLCNNPTLIAISEAKIIWPDCKIGTVVSIGTGGVHNIKEKSPSGIISWVKAIVDSSITNNTPHIYTGTLLGPLRYFRIDPKEYSDIHMLETDKTQLNKIMTLLEKWIDENQSIFEDINKAIKKNE
jgi:patatin-like phospholipase/acyl hydrolase